MSQAERIILGIDPGTNIMGYGLIRNHDNKNELLDAGVVRMEKLGSHALKLKHIFQSTLDLIDKNKPDELAIEAPFFGKDVQAMLKLGRAQGVAMAAALYREVPIFEYAPLFVKKSITGRGNASKEMVAEMLYRMLDFKEKPKYLDTTDGIAVALCHAFQRITSEKGGKYSGWDSFLARNPDRKAF